MEILDMSHVTTPFSEMLHLIPRHVFQKLERRHACDRKSRQFGFREQFTVMAFVMLAASRSLRDALVSLKAQGKRLYTGGWKMSADPRFQMQIAHGHANFLRIYSAKCARFAPFMPPDTSFYSKIKFLALIQLSLPCRQPYLNGQPTAAHGMA